MFNDLDPQVQALLAQFGSTHQADASIAAAPTDYEALRAQMSGLGALGIAREHVDHIEDIEIGSRDAKVRARVYGSIQQGNPARLKGALIFFHGGGFVAGGLDSHDNMLRALANRAKCIVISVDYRLAPEDPYPAANDDAWIALGWVVQHGHRIGVDAERLAVGGDSAGGLLAAWVAQKAAASGLRLGLQILLYPNLDATMSKPSWVELGTGSYIVSQAQMREWYDAYLPSGVDREDPHVSPFFSTQLSGLPPALIVTADHDPLHDEGDEYADKLRAANVQVEHILWPGMIHGFASFAGVLDAGKRLIDQTGEALRVALKAEMV